MRPKLGQTSRVHDILALAQPQRLVPRLDLLAQFFGVGGLVARENFSSLGRVAHEHGLEVHHVMFRRLEVDALVLVGRRPPVSQVTVRVRRTPEEDELWPPVSVTATTTAAASPHAPRSFSVADAEEESQNVDTLIDGAPRRMYHAMTSHAPLPTSQVLVV